MPDFKTDMSILLGYEAGVKEAEAQIERLTSERDEALAERDHLRALLRECLPLVEAQQLAAPPGDTLVARLTAALEE